MKKIGRILFLGALSSLVLTSCDIIALLKKTPEITIYVNGVATQSNHIGNYDINNKPTFTYEVEAEGDIVSDYEFKEGSHSYNHEYPNVEGEFTYKVSVQENDKYKSNTRSVSFALVDDRDTPTIVVEVNLNGSVTFVEEDQAGPFTTSDQVAFIGTTYVGLDVSLEYRSQTGSLGETFPSAVGDYTVTFTTEGNETYKPAERVVSFSLETPGGKPSVGTENITIFAINDFHGQIEETADNAGLIKTFSFLKERKEMTENVLLLDQGDTWQGSIYSNYNRGKLVTDVTNYVGFTARTVGNHDFDWGTEVLEANIQRSYNGYTTPTLAANVYDFDFANKIVGEHADNLGVLSTTKTFESGLKVGIVGVIGSHQITEINSLFVENVSFVDHCQILKDVAQDLRNNGCDIVIGCAHAGQADLMGNGLDSCIDLMLCAHTHQVEINDYEGNMHYAQFGSYSTCVGEVQLTYDYSSRSVTNTNIGTYDAWLLKDTEPDETITNITNTYNEECAEEANVTLAANVTGAFYAKTNNYGEGALSNLMARAIYEKVDSLGYTIDLAMLNNARTSLYSGSWTYADIYNAFPFDNMVYVAQVRGSELIKELVTYTNYFYRSPTFTIDSFNSSATYTIAVIDYVFFHSNDYRNYDFFNFTRGVYQHELEMNYRLILREWLLTNGYTGSKALNPNDFKYRDGSGDVRYKPFTN